MIPFTVQYLCSYSNIIVKKIEYEKNVGGVYCFLLGILFFFIWRIIWRIFFSFNQILMLKLFIPSNNYLTVIFHIFWRSCSFPELILHFFSSFFLTYNTNTNNWVLMWPHLRCNYDLWPNYALKFSSYDFCPMYNPIIGLWFVCTYLFCTLFVSYQYHCTYFT